MVIALACTVPCWPLGPIGVGRVLLALIAIAGVIFSLVMLIDCLRRKRSEFPNPLTKDAEYDRLIWAAAIVASLWFYFLGPIVYFFVVKRAKPEKAQQEE